jgi:SAM-dependent methyltransferase
MAADRDGGPPRAIRRCGACGIGYTDPPPDPTPAPSAGLPGGGLLRSVADAILRHELRPLRGELAPGSRVLDVGAGEGDRARILARDGHRVTAVEPDPVQAARARSLLAGRADVVATSVEDLPPGDGYDAALLSHVLEHLADPDAGLRAVRGRLRPGGLVVVMVPNSGGLASRTFGGRWHGWEPARHRWHHTAATLGRALTDAGYVEVEVRAAGGWLHPTTLSYSVAPGLDPQIHPGPRAPAGRLLTALLAPVALAEVLAGGGAQLVGTGRRPL